MPSDLEFGILQKVLSGSTPRISGHVVTLVRFHFLVFSSVLIREKKGNPRGEHQPMGEIHSNSVPTRLSHMAQWISGIWIYIEKSGIRWLSMDIFWIPKKNIRKYHGIEISIYQVYTMIPHIFHSNSLIYYHPLPVNSLDQVTPSYSIGVPSKRHTFACPART